MRLLSQVSVVATALGFARSALSKPAAAPQPTTLEKRWNLAPKFMIISMFAPEAEAWYGIQEFDVLAQNITIPGLSPLFPDVHCTDDGDVCQVTVGECGKSIPRSLSQAVNQPFMELS
jgi:purine nucleoside permease